MDKNEFFADLLIAKVENIPNDVKKAFVKRSVDDAREFAQIFKEDGHLDLQKLSYYIYRAYTLGAALYDGDKLINAEIGKKSDKTKNDKIINIKNFRNVK